MKKNLNLSSSTSLQALQAKATKAIALAEAKRKEEAAENETNPTLVSKKKNKKKKKVIPAIELDMRSIFLSLTATAGENTEVKMDRAEAGSSCAGKISIFSKTDLLREAAEKKEYEAAIKAGIDKKDKEKPFKAFPLETYGFYPSDISPENLGSVAIYSRDSVTRLLRLRRRGRLFGHRILSSTLRFGIRQQPFLDIRLRP